MKKNIYNCHIHIFTSSYVPDRFLPLGLNKILKYRIIRRVLIYGIILIGNAGRLIGIFIPHPLAKAISFLFERANKSWFSKSSLNLDSLLRYDHFFETGGSPNQSKNFEKICNQYPENTRFVVLPMDMDFMGAGKSALRYEDQLNELAILRDAHPETIIPFFAADPRRENLLDLFHEYIETREFKGVKLYPNLGYFPNEKKLLKIYKICEEKKIPILSHCSPGGVRMKSITSERAKTFAHPNNYIDLLNDYPNLNFCLAHFGGAEEWERHLTGTSPRTGGDASWLTLILDMLLSKKYPNLFTDVSYTLFYKPPADRPFSYFDFLKVLLADKTVADHVLFGTDYYMVEQEKYSEKEVSIALRSHVGEDLYFKIAHENPRKYLYEVQPEKTTKNKPEN